MQKGGLYNPSVLTEEEVDSIANAAMNVKIPSVELKESSKCNILENYLHSDAERICAFDQKALDDQFPYIRDVSVIHGRFANGPINPRCPLTPYEMGVNEAAAWLVRRAPALLTHQRLLSDLARQVVKNSGLNLKQFKSSSQQSNQFYQTPERRLSSNARSGIHYRLQGQYRNSVNSLMDADVISDEITMLNRGLEMNVISKFTENQIVELSRNDVTILNSMNDDIRIEMQLEEVDKVLNEEEILKYSSCTKLEEVRVLKIPCNNYTVIESRNLAKCVRLRELDFSENLLSEFPRDLNLPKLKYLEMTGNRFMQQPLIEQFPNLVVLNFDEKFKQNMNFQAMSFFCPKLKFINGEYFEEPINEYFHTYIMEAKMALDPIIRNKWESEFADRCPNILNNQERMSLIDEMVQQLKDRNLLIDDNLSKYKDLLIFKFTEEYLKSKLNDTEDELLAGGAGSVKRSTSLYCNIEEDDDDDDEKLLERFVDVNQNEMTILQELADELMGNNAQNIVSHVMLKTIGPNGQEQQYIVQQPQPVFHIGQSLRQNKSVVMTVIKPQAVKGRPVAEFLPGELRNKDYVKGYMASEIYKKAVKDTLGQKGTPKKQKIKKQDAEKNWSNNINGPLNEISNSNDPNNKKRGRPPKGIPGVPGNQNYQEAGPEVVERSGIVPARPKKRRTLGPFRLNSFYRPFLLTECRSLRDLYKIDGIENDVIDYDPLHFIRCHAKDNAPLDQDTKVWRCVFEPNPNQPNQTTHIVATCGGECVCLIDCKVGKVMKRFKREDEEFMTLAWTTLEIEPGKRLNILAAAGKLKEIRLLFPDFLHYCDMRGHQEDISALVFHPSMPQILFSGDTKASVFIWDIGTPSANQSRLMRYQLLMRLRCPRLDVNPVLNLVFLDHYSYLVAGCEDGIFAWKITEYRSEKREREPDMELKLFVDDKIDVTLDSISYDGLAQLSRTALVFKIVHNPNLLVFDFGTTLERRKGLQKVVPIDICGTLTWQKTEDFYINVTARQNLGAVLCGDSVGNIWIYDLDPFIEECPERISRDFVCSPYKVLEWPECNVTGNERQISEQGINTSPELKSPVINTVDLSSDGLYIIAVTDNNLVCIWQLSKPN